jgi:hypothetical protein
MISLAGTIGMILTVILLTKTSRNPRPLPFALLLMLAVLETAFVYYYMTTLEVPVQ